MKKTFFKTSSDGLKHRQSTVEDRLNKTYGGRQRLSVQDFLQQCTGSSSIRSSVEYQATSLSSLFQSDSVPPCPTSVSGLSLTHCPLPRPGNTALFFSFNENFKNKPSSPKVVQNVTITNEDLLEDYFIRSMRLSLYIFITPLIIQHNNKSDNKAKLLEQLVSEMGRLAFFNDDMKVMYKQCLNQSSPEELCQNIHRRFFNHDVDLIKRDDEKLGSHPYFNHINYDVKAFLELQIADEFEHDKICLDVLNQLREICVTGRFERKESKAMHSVVSGIIEGGFDMAVKPLTDEARENKKKFKAYISNRYTNLLLGKIKSVYHRVHELKKKENKLLKKKLKNEEKWALEKNKDAKSRCMRKCQAGIERITKDTLVAQRQKLTREARTLGMQEAIWYSRLSQKGVGFSTIFKCRFKADYEGTYTLNFVIDGSRSMGKMTNENSSWCQTLIALFWAMTSAAESWGHEKCRVNLILFAETSELVYNNELLSQGILSKLTSPEGPVNKARERIGKTTNYVSALEKLKECSIEGPVLFYSDGYPTDEQSIESYILNNKIKKQSIDVIPILLVEDGVLENKWLKELGRHGVSNASIDMMSINKRNIASLFSGIVKKELITQDIKRVGYKLYGVYKDGRKKLVDAGYFVCNNLANRLEVSVSGADSFSFFDLRIDGSSEGLLFGVDSSELEKYAREMDCLQQESARVHVFYENQYNKLKHKIELFTESWPKMKKNKLKSEPNLKQGFFSDCSDALSMSVTGITFDLKGWSELSSQLGSVNGV